MILKSKDVQKLLASGGTLRAAKVPKLHKRSKYGAVKTIVDGIVFDSKREAARWGELNLLWRAGKIHNLCRQEKLPFYVNGNVIFTYIADFFYGVCSGGIVYEDCKGFRTPVYRLKKKLIEAQYAIQIKET